jgi:hypothetical protein
MAILREFDCLLEFHNLQFHLESRLISDSLFTLSFVSPDFTERWCGEFSADHLENVTKRAGSLKKLSTFWKMFCSAGLKLSKSVSLDVIVPSALLETLATVLDNKVYIILTQVTEFDQIKYPLRLRRTDFTNEELIVTIRKLYSEKLKLKERAAPMIVRDSVETLEERV